MKTRVVSVAFIVGLFLVGLSSLSRAPAALATSIQKITPGFTPGEIIPFQLQHVPGGQNWQGALMKIHLFDATEISGGTVSLTVSGPVGAGTAVVALTGLATSVSHFFQITNGVASGITPNDIVVNAVANLRPAGSQVGQSSDLDFSLMLFDIRHRTFAETVVFLPSAVIRMAQQWVHITQQTTLVRSASDLRAFNVGNIGVGVDHDTVTVPEPLTMSLLGAGLVSGILGSAIPRRRLR